MTASPESRRAALVARWGLTHGQFAAPESADLVFRSEYQRFNAGWAKVLGWPLFLPPEEGDRRVIATVRVPVTSSQAELDERALVRQSPSADEGEKGIAKFRRFLTETGFPNVEPLIRFLRDLQALRSSGSGHRKGSAYEKTLAGFGIDARRKPEVMQRLLEEAAAALGSLRAFYCPGSVASED